MERDEQRLSRALSDEAGAIEPAADGLARIQARIGGESDPYAVGYLDAARRRRHLRNGIVAGALAVGMAAAATVFAVNGGIHREAVPDPAKSPSPSSTVTFEPSRPSPVRTVYRLGDDPKRAGEQPALFVEYVRNTPPYAPRQSLDGLFGTAPVNSAYSDLLSNGRNKVASTSETDRAIVVDMAAVDTQSRPVGTGDDAAVAKIWVQAWVDTIQDGYSSTKPVLITLKGKPTTLYGYVDTSRPIARDPSIDPIESHDIFLPRMGEKVTSPIDLASSAPDGDYVWKLVNLDTGATPDVAGESGSAGFRSQGDIDLPAGRYRATFASDPGGKTPAFKRTVTFTVTGDAPPSSAPTPVSNPSTGPVEITPVFWPTRSGSGLVQEWRPKTGAEAVVQTLLDAGTGQDDVDKTAWRGYRVTSVVRQPDTITVLLTAAKEPAISRQRRDLAREGLIRTVNAYFGTSLPVATFVNDESRAELSGVATHLVTTQPTETFVPYSDTTVSSPVAVVGGLPDARSSALWYVSDGITSEPLFQGQVPVDADKQAYAFTLDLPPGRYNLLVSMTSSTDEHLSIFNAFTVR